MKTVILALDSLDYHILKDHNGFWSLKQEEYGWVNVKEFLPLLNTPVIWASFATGKPAHTHNVSLSRWNNRVIQLLEDGEKLRGKTILEKLGFKKRKVERIPSNMETFLDYAKKPFTLSVPSIDLYNYQLGKAKDPWIWEQAYNDLSIKHRLVLRMKELYKHKISTVKTLLTKDLPPLVTQDYDLIFCHFWILDVVQHLYYNDPKKILEYYKVINSDIQEIKRICGDCFFLLVSDHGQTRGIHNINAFYSSNIELDLNGPKITDFYKIIVRSLGEE